MTDGVAAQEEEEEMIDEGAEGYADGLGGCSSTVTLGGIQIRITSRLNKTSKAVYFDII